jgi:GT2 family glycosyltransferase
LWASVPPTVPLPPYDVVIATHERLHALRLSLPWLLQQEPPPNRLIVVDSSADSTAVRDLVEGAVAETEIALRFVTARPGLAHQRNVGLAQVESEVVFFPDDDSILHPGAARAILEVYARDERSEIGAVSGCDARLPPPGFERPTYRVGRLARLHRRIAPLRYALERRFIPDVFRVHIRERWASPATPSAPTWLASVDAQQEGWMTGFRMTFRTEAIREVGFDERLSRYGLFEDVDASFSVLERSIVANAMNAAIYHHSAPGARAHGRTLGVMQILNRGYIIYKHTAAGSQARVALKRFGWYKCLLYGLAVTSPNGRRRLAGALSAMRALSMLEQAGTDELGATYERTFARLVGPS